MYKIIYKKKFRDKLDSFISSSLNIFLKLFTDTGIENEEYIRSGYINLSQNFENKIFDEIEKILSKNEILGKSPQNNGNFMITISVNNFRLFIYYKETLELKMRNIEDVEFFKR